MKKISIRDVATEAGVSPSSVSTVVNQKVGPKIRVAQATQDKIWAAVEKLGYVPNPVAQNLGKGRNNIISIFTYENVFPLNAENEFYSFLLGIEEQSEVSGFDILLITNRKFRSHPQLSNENINRLKLGDGGILIGVKKKSETIIKLIEEGFPLVLIGRRDLGGHDYSMVNFDYKKIILKLLKQAIDFGHNRVCYIVEPQRREPQEDRYSALMEAKKSYPSVEVKIFEAAANNLSTADLENLKSEGYSHFFIESQRLAKRIEELSHSDDFRLGKDFSMTLFEDQWFPSKINWNCWSNVRDQLGKASVTLLEQIIEEENPKAQQHLIEPMIVSNDTIMDMRTKL